MWWQLYRSAKTRGLPFEGHHEDVADKGAVLIAGVILCPVILAAVLTAIF
ncbi:hypothetical protein [Devosia soli]|nr:hypothetical protein [Devosia soli]